MDEAKTGYLSRIGQKSERGPREINEDSVFIQDFYGLGTYKRYLCLGAVADGMGGHQAGEIASRTAIEELFEEFNRQRLRYQSDSNANTLELLYNIFSLINKEIYDMSKNDDRMKGMGTTLVVFLAEERILHIAHVGDSRAYIVRGDSLVQLTEDHTLVEKMIQEGVITREEASSRPDRNVITRAIGVGQVVDIDVMSYEILPNDIVLLCTDGLYEPLSDKDIFQVIRESSNMQEAADKLIELAIGRGTNDNATVLLWKMPIIKKASQSTMVISTPGANAAISMQSRMPVPSQPATVVSRAPLLPQHVRTQAAVKEKINVFLALFLIFIATIVGFALGFIISNI